MLTQTCPDRQQLREFVFGVSPAKELEFISEHLDECPGCEESVALMDGDADSFMSALKCPVGDDSFIAEPGFQNSVPNIQAIGFAPEETDEHRSDMTTPDVHRQVGQYKLLEKLGSGGMGKVYKAVHTRLEKLVAVKILRTKRVLDQHAAARFAREMRAVGRLQHENVVQASDAGETDGRQFLVMEYLEGADLSELIRRHGSLSVADACEMVRQAAIGLQHAHQHGLVHRDLKPSNLMLTNEGCVKLLDLGLARFLDDNIADSDLVGNDEESSDGLTVAGHIMGTAEYMAPEQAANSRDVDVRADIYSLGCTLFALLTGKPPFSREDYMSPKRITEAHKYETPPSVADYGKQLPRELTLVIERLLAKEPTDRFNTPLELANALTSFAAESNLTALLAPTPRTHSAPIAPRRNQQDHSRRRRSGVPFSGRIRMLVIGVTLAAGLFLSVIVNLTNRYGTIVVETTDKNVEVIVRSGGEEVEVVDIKSGWKIRIKEGKYEVDLRGAKENFVLNHDSITVTRGKNVTVRVTLKKTPTQKTVPSSPRSKQSAAVETFRLLGVQFTEKKGVVTHFALANSKITDADLAALESLPTLEMFTLIGCKNVTDAGFSHLRHLPHLQQLNLSPSGITDAGLEHVKGLKNLWMLGLNGTRITDAGLAHLVNNRKITVLYLNSTKITDGGLAYLEQMEDMIWMDLGETAITDIGLSRLGHLSKMKLLSVDGTRVTDAGLPRLENFDKLEFLNLNRTAITDAGLKHLAKLPSLQQLLLSDTKVTDAGLIQLVKLTQLNELQLLHTQVTKSGVDAIRIALPKCKITHSPPQVRYDPWFGFTTPKQPKPKPTPKLLEFENAICATFSDNDTLITGDDNGYIRVWDVPSKKQRHSFKAHSNYVRQVAVSPDGKVLASVARDKTIRLWNRHTGKQLRTLPAERHYVVSVDFSPDGRLLASAGGSDFLVSLWDVKRGVKIRILGGHTSNVACVRFSPDGKVLASSGGDKTIRIWSVETGKLLHEFKSHTANVRAVTFSKDGELLASASDDKTLRLWNLETHQLLRTMIGHTDAVWDVAISPTGRFLVSGSSDKSIKLWELKTGKLHNTFTGHERGVSTVAFSPDGTKLISTAGPGSLLRTWTVGDYSYYGSAAELKRWAATLPMPENVDIQLDAEGVVRAVQLGGGLITDDGLSHLSNLTGVEKLKLTYTYGCTADGLKHLKTLTNVTVLNLWGNYNFSDGVMQLQDMTKVENLCLHKIRVTDENMAFLDKMLKCKNFQMTLNPEVTDAGIAHLAKLTQLEDVSLTCLQLTDDCLKYFTDMKNLQRFLISSPHVTKEGLRKMARSLPKLKVVNNEDVEKLFLSPDSR